MKQSRPNAWKKILRAMLIPEIKTDFPIRFYNSVCKRIIELNRDGEGTWKTESQGFDADTFTVKRTS